MDDQLDLVSWLLDYAPPESVNVEDITARVMFINFAAIHTTSLVCCIGIRDTSGNQFCP